MSLPKSIASNIRFMNSGRTTANRLLGANFVAAVADDAATLNALIIQHQVQSNWCWAAVVASIRQFYGFLDLTQCRIASEILNHNCCSDNQNECNQPQSLAPVLAKNRFTTVFVDGKLSEDDIRTRIRDQKRPAIAEIEWGNGLRHFVVIRGFFVEDNYFWVRIADPLFGYVKQPLEEMSMYQPNGAPFAGEWLFTFLADPIDQPLEA